MSHSAYQRYITYSPCVTLYTLDVKERVRVRESYSIKFLYPPTKSELYKENITYAASIELFLHNIHSTQSSASILTLESSRDRVFALMLLSDFSPYAIQALD